LLGGLALTVFFERGDRLWVERDEPPALPLFGLP
jgi:hypothetical protein